MKKILLFGIGLCTSVAALAQADVVKNVEHELKGSSPNFANALKDIQPALTDPSTAGTVMPWYLAGKASFGIYDNAYIRQSTGNELTPEETRQAGHALIDGYNYYFKALPLDSVPDAKGKIKPKKSKDMLKEIAAEYPQLRNAGVFLYNIQDYDGAFDAWELYVTLPQNKLLGKSAPVAHPDTIVGEIMFNQGLAKIFTDDNKTALDKMYGAIALGYQTPTVYTVGIEAARRLGDTVSMYNLAHKGYDLYGTKEISFIGQLINERMEQKDYAGCLDLVNQALASTSADNTSMLSQLYDVRGIIYDEENKYDEAVADFTKAIELDPNFAKAYFDKGRVMYNNALKLDESGDPEIGKNVVVPILIEVAPIFEKAYELNETELRQIPGILYRLYYRLGAGYEEQAKMWEALQ